MNNETKSQTAGHQPLSSNNGLSTHKETLPIFGASRKRPSAQRKEKAIELKYDSVQRDVSAE